MSVAVPGERLAFTPELVPLQEEEREEEQLCEAGGAADGGHHREEPTAGGEEDHSWRGVGRDWQLQGPGDRLQQQRSLVVADLARISWPQWKAKIYPRVSHKHENIPPRKSCPARG